MRPLLFPLLFGSLIGCAGGGGSAGMGGAGSTGATLNGGSASGALGGSGGTENSSGAAAANSSGGSVASGGAPGGAGSGGANVAGESNGAGTGGSGGATSTLQHPDIMVLGSSNELITCWRAFLWQELHQNGITDFDFVGDVTDGPDCGVAGYDKDLRAQSGIIISNLTAQQFDGWFTAHPPDVILMHFGGADLLNNLPIDGIINAYTLALTEARKVKPHVRLLIGEHTPQPTGGSVTDLNAQIVTWAAAHSTADSPVSPVDLYTGLDPMLDFSDGVHLNEAGSHKVADRWYAALAPLFGH